MDENKVTYFAETDSRGKKIKFGIKQKDRSRHVYVIGKTGMGKSTLLENMAAQDIIDGNGMCFIDPHGKTAELLLEYVPEHRKNDVLYFAPFDLESPVSFNVLEKVDPDKRHLVVSGLMSTFKKIWVDAWSARMEYILSNALLALLEYPDATLLSVNRMLSDKEYRKRVVENVTDPTVKSFWNDEFAKYTERMAAEAVPAIQNKVGQFTSNSLIRNMIGQPRSSFNIREMMDERKIIIVNLSKGRVGEQNANLLGGLLITKIYLAAMSRADVPDRILKTLPNFYLYVDEFQSFANKSFADILSEARKYKLNLTIAHQYIEQMEEEVRDAVFGNVGTMILFRVGAFDAEVFEKEYAPVFTAEDIVNLGIFQIYLKLMIDGVGSQPFSASTLPPIAPVSISHRDEVVAASKEQFAKKRVDVEEEIRKWHEPMVAVKAGKGGSGSAAGPAGAKGGAVGASVSPAASTTSSTPVTPASNSAPAKASNNTQASAVPASAPARSVASSVSSPAPIQPPAPSTRTVNHEPAKPVFSKPEEKREYKFAEVFKKANITEKFPPAEEKARQTPPATSAHPVVHPAPATQTAPAAPAVPLATLAPKPKFPQDVKKIADREIRDKKMPTESNLSDLRKALSNIVKKEAVQPVGNRAPAPSTPVAPKPQNSNSNEVPEEVLRRTLKVEGENDAQTKN